MKKISLKIHFWRQWSMETLMKKMQRELFLFLRTRQKLNQLKKKKPLSLHIFRWTNLSPSIIQTTLWSTTHAFIESMYLLRTLQKTEQQL